MTDNEIIKDLECCAKRGNCNICSRYTIPYPTCKEQLCKSACHLIHILSNNADNAFQEGLNENRELFKSEVEAEVFNKIREDLESLKGYISIGYTPRYARELWERIDSFFEKYLPEYAADVSNCQQSSPLPCNIGDTAYCVNGYGSNRYIEKFTVAEINIRKVGIWLTDTNGMEWLARVCLFSRESAEKELRASEVTKPDYCSFFYNRFMKTE